MADPDLQIKGGPVIQTLRWGGGGHGLQKVSTDFNILSVGLPSAKTQRATLAKSK